MVSVRSARASRDGTMQEAGCWMLLEKEFWKTVDKDLLGPHQHYLTAVAREPGKRRTLTSRALHPVSVRVDQGRAARSLNKIKIKPKQPSSQARVTSFKS